MVPGILVPEMQVHRLEITTARRALAGVLDEQSCGEKTGWRFRTFFSPVPAFDDVPCKVFFRVWSRLYGMVWSDLRLCIPESMYYFGVYLFSPYSYELLSCIIYIVCSPTTFPQCFSRTVWSMRVLNSEMYGFAKRVGFHAQQQYQGPQPRKASSQPGVRSVRCRLHTPCLMRDISAFWPCKYGKDSWRRPVCSTSVLAKGENLRNDAGLFKNDLRFWSRLGYPEATTAARTEGRETQHHHTACMWSLRLQPTSINT